jgi:hypothetical protein
MEAGSISVTGSDPAAGWHRLHHGDFIDELGFSD